MVLLALPVFAAPEVSSFEAPPLGSEVQPPPDLVLLYSGEQHGEIGPCGCDAAPKGGLGRLAALMAQRRREQPDLPLVLLNPGAFLSSKLGVGALTERAVSDNVWFQQALDLVPYDALLVTARDLPSVKPRELDRGALISASHSVPGGIIVPYVTLERGGLRIAVTGVSSDGLTYLQPEGTTYVPPVEAVQRLMSRLSSFDVVVVLVYNLPKEAAAIAELPGVDVVIEAGSYVERWPPLARGDAVWVRSRDEGASVGELRLWVEQGRVVRAVDRSIRIGEDLPSDRRIDRLERKQDKAGRAGGQAQSASVSPAGR